MSLVASADSSSRTRSLRILCVEDHEQMAMLTKTILERAGHRVDYLTDSREAWNQISSNPSLFDVIVTDSQMPELTGLELIRNLRQLGFPGRIYVQTARLSMADEEAYHALDIDGIVYKPGGLFHLATLI